MRFDYGMRQLPTGKDILGNLLEALTKFSGRFEGISKPFDPLRGLAITPIHNDF